MALVTLLMAFGGAWITPVALKDIAAEAGGAREVPALASALAWLCSGVGGIILGRVADRIGTRWTVLGGALMIGLGLAISTLGPPRPLWIGHGLFIGLLGLGGINAPKTRLGGRPSTCVADLAPPVVVAGWITSGGWRK